MIKRGHCLVTGLCGQTLVRSINVLVGPLLGCRKYTAAHYQSTAIVELSVQDDDGEWSHEEIDDCKGSGPATYKQLQDVIRYCESQHFYGLLTVFAKVSDNYDKVEYDCDQVNDSSLKGKEGDQSFELEMKSITVTDHQCCIYGIPTVHRPEQSYDEY